MLQVIIENEYGQQLDFAGSKDYLIKVAGLTPSSATINTAKIASKDGEQFNSSTLDMRNIILTIIPLQNIEKNRINLYKYIQPKKYIKLYLKNGARDVWIDGRVENLEGDLYEETQQFQISIICTDPYFKAVESVVDDFAYTTPVFTFPFAITSDGTIIETLDRYTEKNIVNTSDNEHGIIIELHANALALEPTVYNMTTNKSFTIQHEFQPGDVVRINTRAGERSLMLIRDGVETNILNSMLRGSSWLELIVGDNIFTYTAVEGAENLQLTIKQQPTFTGV